MNIFFLINLNFVVVIIKILGHIWVRKVKNAAGLNKFIKGLSPIYFCHFVLKV